MELSFIVVDDSELDCFIARKIIEHADGRLKVTTYPEVHEALTAINNNLSAAPTTIILLDLQMPTMNGFQFVEEFEQLPAEIQKNYFVVILSSSRNSNDLSRILAYNCVQSTLEKPFTREKLLSVIMQVQNGG